MEKDEPWDAVVIGGGPGGDVVRGLNQLTVSEAEGAIAATAIHNRLRLDGAPVRLAAT
jgi:hypothetical protein